MGEPLLERRRARRGRARSRGPAAARVVPARAGPRAGRRTRSCRRRRRARRRRTRACCRARGGRRPCGRPAARRVSWHRGHQYVGRLSSHCPRTWMREASRSAGRGARAAVDAPEARLVAVARGLAASAGGRRRRSPAPRRRRPRRSAATDRCPPRSSPRPSRGCRCRRGSAGRAARRRSAASGRPRAAGAGSARRRTRGRGCRGRGAAMRWSKRGARLGHQLEHRPVELDDLALAARGREPRAPRRAAASAAPRREHPPRAGHAQVRVDGQAALEAQEEVLAVGVDRA